MRSLVDLRDIPEWHFVQQEAKLIRQILGAGATALGQANYADKKGEYYRAFFELSVGIERLAKLILVTGHAVENNGELPPENFVRSFGHKLSPLLAQVEKLVERREFTLVYQRPRSPICSFIVENLDAFADASRGRYANFAALSNPSNVQHEPVAKWWKEVAELILKERYYGTKLQKRVEDQARFLGAALEGVVYVQHTSETREAMSEFEVASQRSGQTKIVQRWGRYHTLELVRWLSSAYRAVSQHAAIDMELHAFYGSWEHFYTFHVEDEFLKNRKIWPLR